MLEPKVALVTGGASGLGLATVELLISKGYHVVVLDINKKALDKLPSCVESYCVDITDEKQVFLSIDQIIKKNKKIDVLVNNAGTIYSSPLVNFLNAKEPIHSFSKFKEVIDINLNAVFLVGSIVAQKMIMLRNPGVIINISSICSIGNPGQSAYSAAKAGVNALTRTWARELGAFNIRVVSVSPGFINTPSTNQALDFSLISALKQKIALKKLGTAESVAKLILTAIENDYISGSVLSIDGGCSL